MSIRFETARAKPAPYPDHGVCRYCSAGRLCKPAPEGEDPALNELVIKRHRPVSRGGFVFRAGDPMHSLYAVCSGSVKTCAIDDEGAVQVTGFHIPGELVGMNGLPGKRHVYDAIALEPTTVCEILYSRLEELRDETPTLRRHLFDVMGDQIARDQRLIAVVMGKQGAGVRLAAFLCHLADKCEKAGMSAREIHLAMCRYDIGNHLGLAKETVSRLFVRFEHDGLIKVNGRRLTILDSAALKARAGCAGEIPAA